MVEAIQANGLLQILLLTLMAGAAMPVGAALASVERIHPGWLESELHHSVIAFGGGALLAAVALVLVPEGTANLPMATVVACFAAGGITFMLIDRWLAAKGSSASQLVAMLTDFVPEALALGATFSVSSEGGVLLAGIIALQNLPEGFNSYRELAQSTHYRGFKIVGIFALMALLGPASGAAGYFFLSDSHHLVSGIMLFAAGGILYIIFQDIAPQSRLEKHWGPPLGAVAGFLLGLIGSMMLSG